MTTNDRTMGYERGVAWAMSNAPAEECQLVADWINGSTVPATITLEDLPATRRWLHTAFAFGLDDVEPIAVDDFTGAFLEGMASGWFADADDLDEEDEPDAEILVLEERRQTNKEENP